MIKLDDVGHACGFVLLGYDEVLQFSTEFQEVIEFISMKGYAMHKVLCILSADWCSYIEALKWNKHQIIRNLFKLKFKNFFLNAGPYCSLLYSKTETRDLIG